MSDFPSVRYKLHPGNDKTVMQTTVTGQEQSDKLEADGWTGDLGSIMQTHPNEGAKPRFDFVHVQVEDVLAMADELGKKSGKAEEPKKK
jgi:hypothetical protein